MLMKTTKLILSSALVFTLTACGMPEPSASQGPDEAAQAELDENAPIDNTDGLTPETSADGPEAYPMATPAPYTWPKWSSSMGISSAIFNRAQKYYDQHWSEFTNTRYVVLVDLGLHSSKKRFLLIDLKSGAFEKHNTSHGAGSDTNKDGYAESFSNVSGSNKSSLGFYKTLYTYNGKNGRSLRIDGLEASNSNALARAIVVHSASYVSDKKSTAGRSLGCPALDPSITQPLIDKIKGGAMFLIATSR